MSRIVVIRANDHGRIEMSEEQLQQMLDDAYNQGYADGTKNIVVSPYVQQYPWITSPVYPWTVTYSTTSKEE